MKALAIRLITFYQKLSRTKNPTCRYHPTCSQYAKEAFQKRHFIYALWLTFYRIIRCNPLSKGGYNPVPEKPKKEKNHG